MGSLGLISNIFDRLLERVISLVGVFALTACTRALNQPLIPTGTPRQKRAEAMAGISSWLKRSLFLRLLIWIVANI